MNILFYQGVPCRACHQPHDLYLVLDEAARADVRSVRYACPISGEIVGERLTGSAERPERTQPGWLECAPVYSSLQKSSR